MEVIEIKEEEFTDKVLNSEKKCISGFFWLLLWTLSNVSTGY